MNTFSANSLKLLDKSFEDFEKKYILKLDFFGTKTKSAKSGENLHALISYHLCGYDIKKLENALNNDEKELFLNAKNYFKETKNFIKVEESFLVKEKFEDIVFYLSGRFDAIYRENNEIIIYDWKSKNIPLDAQNDLQTVVYLNCGSKIFGTKNISVCYFSLATKEICKIKYDPNKNYIEVIGKIISKLPKKYLN